ncbi:uncharacterized protein LOC144925156 isoform X1 [Branchiostoma floridae x Branchiostoma belcheri]
MSGAPEVVMISDTGQWWIWKKDGKVAFVNDGDGLGTIEDVWKQRRLAIRTVRRLLRDRSNNTCTGRGKQWRGHGQATFCREVRDTGGQNGLPALETALPSPRPTPRQGSKGQVQDDT